MVGSRVMVARVFATLLFVTLLAATVARPDETRRIDTVLNYGPGTKLLQHSASTLSDVAQAAWDTEFRPMPYFAALALAESGGFGYATTVNSRAAARAIAMSECVSMKDQCRIIADIPPGGYADLAITPTWSAFKAGAISADGAFSFVWGHPSQGAAAPDASSWPCRLVPPPDSL